MADSLFKDVEMGAPIEVFQLTKLYNECQHSDKVNLGVGAYRTDEGQPWVLPVVRAAEMQMANDKTLNHEYLPVSGLPDFRDAAIKLLFGSNHKVITENRVGAFQALGGTNALRLSAAFLKDILQYDTVYVSAPTWGNHKSIFKRAGFSDIREYRYWDADNRELNFNGMIEDLSAAPEKSVFILHAVAHNPTGMDPTKEQWQSIFQVCKEKKVFVILDIAYQGFASGSLEEDGWAIRYFADNDIDMFVAQSFSKNFGLYNERVGALHFVCTDANKLPSIRSQMEWIIRTMYSNPSNHGARIVATVLNNKAYLEDWKTQLSSMATRVKKMRQELVENLKKAGTPGTWDHITRQIGMFSYTGLTPKQVDYCKSKYMFLLNSGRINIAGLNSKNIGQVTKIIDEAVRTHPTLGLTSRSAVPGPEIEVISFVELAKRKLQESTHVISAGVTIDGVIVQDDLEADMITVQDKASEEDILDFVKVKLSGNLSEDSMPELKVSVFHSILEPRSGERTSQTEIETEHKSTTMSLMHVGSDNYSVETQANTVISTVKTFSSRGAQTQKIQEAAVVAPKSIPARFRGTMSVPMFFEGLAMTPDKLEVLMQEALARNENASIPVEFKGNMITAAFKSLTQGLLRNNDGLQTGAEGDVLNSIGVGDSEVKVKFEGRLQGILTEDTSIGISQNGIPVVFEGIMSRLDQQD